MAAFRTLPVDTPESLLSGVSCPKGLDARAPRPGVALTFDWYVVFVDGAGQPMIGGSATLQWYGVEFDGAACMTPELGDAVTVDALQTRAKSVGAGRWPWCRITAMTPPVTNKIVEVRIPSAEDGTYSIEVVDGDTESFLAVVSTVGQIVDGLLTELQGNGSGITVSAPATGKLRFEAAAEFELVLTSPGDVMTQEDINPLSDPAETMRVYLAESASMTLADESREEFAAAAAAAVVAELPTPEESTESLAAAVSAAIVVPDTADILAQVQAGIQAECAPGGAIESRVNPALLPKVKSLTGATSHLVESFVTDSYNRLWGFTITTDAATTVTWWSGNAASMSAKHELPANGEWTISRSGAVMFTTNLEDAILLKVSNASANIHVTYYHDAKYAF